MDTDYLYDLLAWKHTPNVAPEDLDTLVEKYEHLHGQETGEGDNGN